ncbi:hypothetical protein BpHYR1_029660 [Brachionus plicatilis]|uniref:Uncharacterized protein n=1 Tax=Brachionus plicatilis TaxID=10195 RepID=A0A3M7QX85_BRAPC|nr:hypothetical protein BpHYR1_029660 [Brachionus plicatilis]
MAQLMTYTVVYCTMGFRSNLLLSFGKFFNTLLDDINLLSHCCLSDMKSKKGILKLMINSKYHFNSEKDRSFHFITHLHKNF